MGTRAAGRLDVRADDWTLSGAPHGSPAIERMSMHAAAGAPEGRNAIDFVQLPGEAARDPRTRRRLA